MCPAKNSFSGVGYVQRRRSEVRAAVVLMGLCAVSIAPQLAWGQAAESDDAAEPGGAAVLEERLPTLPLPQHDGVTSIPGASSASARVEEPRRTVPPVSPVALETVLADAATDLGLVLDERPAVVESGGATDTRWEDAIVTPSPGRVSLGAALESKDERWFVRIILVRDDGTTHSVRTEVGEADYEVQTIRALAMLADVRATPVAAAATGERAAPVKRDVSHGRATLATTGAVLGGYFGFALENAGGDVDTRLVYPLVALGAGVGLASALIIAEEWPMDRPSAWYISGGGLWLTLSGVLIAGEQDLKHPTDRYPYGLIGTVAGLGISSYMVSQREISEAEAIFSQSGALFGTIAGGLAQELIEPGNGAFPKLGVGIGAGGGWLLASMGTAHLMPGLTSSRVLFADLGGFLGTLVGAAAASPTVVTQGQPKAENSRVFFGASLAGLAVGSVVGYWLGGHVEEGDTDLMSVSLRADTLPSTLPSTPFESRLPAATALTLHSRW